MSELKRINGKLIGLATYNSGYTFTLKGKLNIGGIERQVEMRGERDDKPDYSGTFEIIQPDGEMTASFSGKIGPGRGTGRFDVKSATGIFEGIDKKGFMNYTADSTGAHYKWTVSIF